MTLYELREFIRPFVEKGHGAEVRSVINKYAHCLSLIPPEKHSEFCTDVLTTMGVLPAEDIPRKPQVQQPMLISAFGGFTFTANIQHSTLQFL